MPKPIAPVRAYRGCIIYHNTAPGYALRWRAITPQGYVSADTLAGVKKLIRNTIKYANA